MIRINIKVWMVTFLIAIFVITMPSVFSECQPCDDVNSGHSSGAMVGTRNPAAVYCAELGYEYKTVQTEQGERGVCVLPNDDECDAWEFLEGKVGQEYSYCARIGCDIETVADGKNPFSSDYATCVPRDASKISSGEGNSVTDLMNLEEKVHAGSFHIAEPKIGSYIDVNAAPDLPQSFDWRDVDGQNWVTSVKNQGSCGSCWAFATIGAVESKVNIAMDNPDFDLDLSEQYLVSDCCAYCGDCSGGWPAQALTHIRDCGIIDEACYPYTASYSSCSDRCSLWDKRLISIDGYGGVGIDSIKDVLIDYGPLVFYMAIHQGGSFDDDNIYRNSTLPVNHAILLVGYNETGEYWIAKNSWGTSFGEDGYFKIGYNECYVTYYNPLAVIITENTYYNYPLPLPTPRPTSIPLPTSQIPDPVPLPEVMMIPLPIPLPFFVPIPLPIPLP